LSFLAYIPRTKEARWEYGYGGIKTVPGHSRLASLPYRARVAITVRCALRVRPYFEPAWPDVPWAITHVLDHLINFALCVSEGRPTAPRTRLTFETVRALCELCRIQACRYERESQARRHIIASGNILSLAMQAGLTADPSMSKGMIGRPSDRSRESYKGDFQHFSCDRAARALCDLSAIGSALWQIWDKFKHSLTAEMRRDFLSLERHARRKRVTDDSPFPQSLFGKMWMSRPPKVVRIPPKQWVSQLLEEPNAFS
jgi:hypothetical protein